MAPPPPPPRRALLRCALTLALLCAAAWPGAAAQAQVPPGTPIKARPPAAPEGAASGGLSIGSVRVRGELLDPPAALLKTLDLRPHEPYRIEDEAAALALLDQLGYYVVPHRRVDGKQVHLEYELSPQVIIREVRITGNTPIPEEEVRRRTFIRAGQVLPLTEADIRRLYNLAPHQPIPPRRAGEDPLEPREVLFRRQEAHLKKFLEEVGYLQSEVEVSVQRGKKASQAIVIVRIVKGLTFTVGKIEVEGNKQGLKTEQIQAIVRRTVGTLPCVFGPLFQVQRCYTDKKLKEATERVEAEYRKRGYFGVWVRAQRPRYDLARRQVDLRIIVREGKRIEVRFVGTRRSPKVLREQITLAEEGSYEDYDVKKSVRALVRYLQRQGRFEAQVTAVRMPLGRDAERITFRIEEGPERRVARVEVSGNRAIPTKELLAEVETRRFPPLGRLGLGEGGYTTPSQLARDAEKLTKLHVRRGYVQARVRPLVASHPDALEHPGATAALATPGIATGNPLYVRFVVEEGPLFKVEDVTFEGNNVLDKMTLLDALVLRPGAPFDPGNVDADRRRLLELYAARGRPYRTLVQDVKVDEKRHRARITYRIAEGAPAVFGHIYFRGNFRTHAGILRRELPFKPGQLYNETQRVEAERNLRNTGLFNAVTVRPLGISEQRERIDIVVEVDERDPLWPPDLELGFGYSIENCAAGTVQGPIGTLVYRYRNVGGWGHSFELRTEASFCIKPAITALYRIPRILDSYFNLEFSTQFKNEETIRLGPLQTLTHATALSRELTRRLRAALRFEYRRVVRDEELQRSAAAGVTTPTTGIVTSTVAFGPTIAWDRRDNPLNPRKGFRIGGAAFIAHTFGEQFFWKFNLNQQAFLQLDGSPTGWLLSQQLRWDWGIPIGRDHHLLPLVERFFAGGDTTVRGYTQDTLRRRLERAPVFGGPAVAYVQRLVPVGGNVRLLLNLELQTPIWRKSILFGLPLAWAVFLDVGAVSDAINAFTASSFRPSVGLALLRLVLPFGSLSLEYGIPLLRQPGDDTTFGLPGRFHFNFGLFY